MSVIENHDLQPDWIKKYPADDRSTFLGIWEHQRGDLWVHYLVPGCFLSGSRHRFCLPAAVKQAPHFTQPAPFLPWSRPTVGRTL